MDRFDAKDPSEKVVLTFDFSAGLSVGETLNGTPTTAVSVLLGADVSPAAILNGAASLSTDRTQVYQAVQAGHADTDYLIKVVVGTTNAAKVLALAAVLPVTG